MDNFHFSTTECFENCPARFDFRYRQNIEVLPTDDPANPLILGTAIHRGMEKDMETAIQEYKDSYPIITDAHINEIIKLEYWIPKMKELLPEGFHEVNFKNDVYEGTADLIVPCTKHDAGLPHNINHFIFQDALSEEEMDVITRDDAFAKPIFYKGKTFLHNAFGQYMKNEYHIKRIQGQLHVYDGGIYKSGYRFIESKMVELIPTLKANHRVETLKYLEIITPEETQVADANLIAFRNGLYDLATDELLPFSPDHVITNMIPWDYNPEAYSELCDKTLNKISCQDDEIRALLEECIGYCFFRQNELSKSFFLTGSGSNGKSTFLDMVKNVLGRPNYVSLDMDELGERFSTTTMFGKLANIGDDISDEFLQGKVIAQFKKIVSGNDIKAENKGQDAYFFKPTVKLLFSANEIPRMRNKGFEAIKRRLVIIPFNAKFSKNDDDFDAGITWKLKKQDVAEYLIKLGIEGLKRVLTNQGFTESQKVKDEVDNFEKDNNPILLFLEEVEEDEILNHETKEVFARYDTFCNENGFTRIAMQTFTKEIKKHLGCDRKDVRLNGKKAIIFIK